MSVLTQRDIAIIRKFADCGKWESFLLAFSSGASCEGLNRFQAYQIFFDSFPDSQKYDLTMLVYTSCESVGKHMGKYFQKVKKLRPADALEPIKNNIDANGYIAIYHGGIEVEKPELSLSWTISKDVAVWFAKRFQFMGDTVLYIGEIPTKEIIAYYNGREEQEIVQYRSIKKIEILEQFRKADWIAPN